MPRLFVAYARRDAPLVSLIVGFIERAPDPPTLWFAERDVRGLDVRDEVLHALRQADGLVFCASRHSAPAQAFLGEELREAVSRRRSESTFRIVAIDIEEGALLPPHLPVDGHLEHSEPEDWRWRARQLVELVSQEKIDEVDLRAKA